MFFQLDTKNVSAGSNILPSLKIGSSRCMELMHSLYRSEIIPGFASPKFFGEAFRLGRFRKGADFFGALGRKAAIF